MKVFARNVLSQKQREPVREKTPKGGIDESFAMHFPNDMMLKGKWITSIKDWADTMKAALINNADPTYKNKVDDTYNEFSVSKVSQWLTQWDGKIQLMPAREYSVALYIKGDKNALQGMQESADNVKADEVDILEDGTLRLWWD